MDRRLLERLIGAGVLVVALVIVVPAILDGSSDSHDDGDAQGPPARSAPDNGPRRTHTIRLNQKTQTPPVARAISPPVTDPEQEPARSPAQSASNPGKEPAKSPTVVKPKTEKLAAVEPQPVKTAAPPRAEPKPASVPEPPSSTPVTAPKTSWVVQLGSFSSQQNARRLANDVGGHGFPVFLMSLDRSGKKLYRVRVGPLETRAQATELAGRLAKLGYSGQVMQ